VPRENQLIPQKKQAEDLLKSVGPLSKPPKKNKKEVRVCRLWGIHPKSIYKKHKEEVMGHYFKESDDKIFELIRPIILARPSYGYKRVTAMLNRQQMEFRLPRYNKKRIYRIMRLKGAILPKFLWTREHQPTGVVLTLHLNTRWCSNGFEIKCFNGEKVYVAFVLDCCDREAISYVARTRPLIAEDIQSLMIDSVEKRFAGLRASRQIEFLSDRGSIYRAYNVQNLARQLNLKSCFTTPYSP
jgi:putative transposase